MTAGTSIDSGQFFRHQPHVRQNSSFAFTSFSARLRRGYFEILRDVLAEAGSSFEELVVVDDIFELDLAMLLALGARVGLITTSRTPDYERAFVTAHPRAMLIEDLAQIPTFAFG